MWQRALGPLCKKIALRRLSTAATIAGRVISVQNASWPTDLRLHTTWLRDHCRCDNCYNHSTGMKNVQIAKLGLHIEPKDVTIKGQNLHLVWPDGHESLFSLNWLWENSKHDVSWEPTFQKPWTGIGDFAKIDYEDFLNSNKAVLKLLSSVITFGVGLVQKVPFETTVYPQGSLAETIAHVFPAIRLGYFGRSFTGHPSKLIHSSKSCSDMIISPHTDQSYLTEPAGLKVIGGSSDNVQLVDSFAIMQHLKDTDAESWKSLHDNPICFEYNDSSHCYKATDTIVKLHPETGRLWRFRYSPYHRGTIPIGLGLRQIERTERAVNHLSALMSNDIFQMNLGNISESLVFIDNWRVSVGMTVTTKTHIAACFASHSDLMSVARTLREIPSHSPLRNQRFVHFKTCTSDSPEITFPM